eukprot:7683392-Pyramimonas_sp.AAC.1
MDNHSSRHAGSDSTLTLVRSKGSGPPSLGRGASLGIESQSAKSGPPKSSASSVVAHSALGGLGLSSVITASRP